MAVVGTCSKTEVPPYSDVAPDRLVRADGDSLLWRDRVIRQQEGRGEWMTPEAWKAFLEEAGLELGLSIRSCLSWLKCFWKI